MFTAGEAAIGARVPVPERVLVVNVELPPTDGVPSSLIATLPGFVPVTAAPEIVIENGVGAEPSPLTDHVADANPAPRSVTAVVFPQLHAGGMRTLTPLIACVPSPTTRRVSAMELAFTRRTPGEIEAVPEPSPGSKPKSVWLRGFSRR